MIVTNLKRVLVLPDFQIPYHDERSIAAVLQYASTVKWDELILLGDFMDFDQISRWTDGLPGKWETSIQQDYRIANRMLNRIDRIVAPTKKTFIMGNHDIRAEKLTYRFPQLKGQIEVETPNGLNLTGRGYRVVRAYPDGEVYKVGNALFTHGLYTNKHHAAKMAEVFGQPIYYGHVHDVQAFSRVTHGDDKTVEAHSLGCLCKYRQDYLLGPTNWQQAFGVFFFRPNGFFNMYCVRIFQHRFIGPDGREYVA